jgi:hypothetical protein
MSNPRIRRPEPQRVDPIRHWTGVFGHEGAPPSAPRAEAFAKFAQAATRNPGGAVADGVATGYRVIEDHLREGRRAAAKVMPSVGDTHGAGFRPPAIEPTLDGLYRAATDLLSSWFQVVSSVPGLQNPGAWQSAPPGSLDPGCFTAGGPREGVRTAHDAPLRPEAPPADPPAGATPPAPATGATAPAAGLPVKVRLRSLLPVEVGVDLFAGAASRPLRVHDLRDASGDLPRLRGASLSEPSPGAGLRFELAVPETHPPGTYVGAVVDDETGRGWGTVTVTVGADP